MSSSLRQQWAAVWPSILIAPSNGASGTSWWPTPPAAVSSGLGEMGVLAPALLVAAALFMPLALLVGGIPRVKTRSRSSYRGEGERPITDMMSIVALYARLQRGDDLEEENRVLREESDMKGELIAALESELVSVGGKESRVPSLSTPRSCASGRHQRTSSWGSDLVSVESLQANAALVALRLEKEAMEERWTAGDSNKGGSNNLPPRPRAL